jgi:hypothetical protein
MKGRRKNRYKAGDYNVISDRSGQKLKRSQCKFTWDGFLVGIDEWEPRQPQDFVEGRSEDISVADPRPRGEDKFFVPTADDL